MKNLHLAAKVALKDKSKKKYYLGAVAKRQDGTIVKSHNSRTRVPVASAHAEMKVLKKTGKKGILWVARVLADGSWGMAKPCKNCQGMIKNMDVLKVYYTISDGEYGVWYPTK